MVVGYLVGFVAAVVILALAMIANRPTGPQPQPVAYGYNQSTTSG